MQMQQSGRVYQCTQISIFFLNYEKIGTEKCMSYIFMLVVIFFGINLMMIFIDNFWERIKKNMV